jgi:signal recognition particle receptor subunit beta
MVVVSYSGKEINAKLVYYGPGLSGKTTNLEHIYQSVPSTNRGKMVSMKTRTERTLFFDFLPVDLGEIGGFKTRFLLYTVPGQVYYNATRKLVLRGVDAVIFVADSGPGKMEENLESLENLRENLREYGLSIDEMPWVIQYNKRDLPNAYTIEELEAALNPAGVPHFEAVATTGDGVFECFRGTARILLQKLSQEIKLGTTKPSALTAPKPTEAGDTVSSAPPPGLMSGAAPGKGYRPPLPTVAKPGAVPPAVPHPPRPSAPSPPAATAAGDSSASLARPYRPPVPGQAAAPAAGPAAPRRPLPEPRPGASRIMPSPVTPPPPPIPEPAPEVSGADWFEEEAAPETAHASDEAFAPTLELDETAKPATPFETGAAWVKEAGASNADYAPEAGYIETVRDDDPQDLTLSTERGAALARHFEDDLPSSDPGDSLEEEPGFWGRIFKRKGKDREAEQFRRYPTPDLAARTKPTPDLTATEPRFAPPPRVTAPEPLQKPAVTLKREIVRPAPVAEPAASWTEGPVVVERTVHVPVHLGPEEVRRGAILKLTLDIVIDGSRSGQDREEAA